MSSENPEVIDYERIDDLEYEIIGDKFRDLLNEVEKKETEQHEKKPTKLNLVNDDEWSDLELLSLQDLANRPSSPGTIGLKI